MGGFGAALGGYSHAQHPVALLGADGVAHSLAFNLLGFVLPGLLAVVVAVELRQRASAGWQWRIGSQLLLLAAVAFAAQGLLPMDLQQLDGPQSRYHALAWTCGGLPSCPLARCWPMPCTASLAAPEWRGSPSWRPPSSCWQCCSGRELSAWDHAAAGFRCVAAVAGGDIVVAPALNAPR